REGLREHRREALCLDVRALALGRVGLALLVIADLWARSADVTAQYSDAGWLPRAAVTPSRFWGFRIYSLSGDPDFVAAMMVTTAVVAALFAVGWRTRIVNLLLWLLVGSLHARNGPVLQGGDKLLLNFLFWFLFLPIGSCWSLDARRRREPAPQRVHGAPAVAIYVQLFLVYAVTGSLKLKQAHWLSGEGVYHALSADFFVTSFGRALYPHWHLLQVLSWSTMLLEIGGAVALLLAPPSPRLRTGLVAAFVLFHVGVGLSLQLGLFSMVCIACWLVVLPSWALDRVTRAAPRPSLGLAATPWLSRLAGLAIAYMAVATAVVDLAPPVPLRDAVAYPMRVLRLQDRWALFIGPRKTTGWMVVEARYPNGVRVDLLRGGTPVSYERPESVLDIFPNQRWRKVITNLRKAGHHQDLMRYLSWQCRQVDAVAVRFIYVRHRVGKRYDHGPAEKVVVAEQRCRPEDGMARTPPSEPS
ncbi:MAG: HTTM domain-containing protein, partial [Polyangiaceae bacterium]